MINILQVERSTLHVYLSDMGLARIKMGCSTMTHVQIVGTPIYAAQKALHLEPVLRSYGACKLSHTFPMEKPFNYKPYTIMQDCVST